MNQNQSFWRNIAKGSGEPLDTGDRINEILFGLIMVLTFTCSISVASEGREEIRTVLIGALGCNIAWGLIDGLFFLLGTIFSRGEGLETIRVVRSASDDEGSKIVKEAVEEHEEHWSVGRATGSLIVASLLAAFMSEILVGSAEETGKAMGMTTVFIGMIILAVVGGAAESLSAITMASKNKVDLTMSIALGSCIQIALLIAPLAVLFSYFIGPQPLNLTFGRVELGVLFLAVLMGIVVASDGKSNWFKGIQLVIVYLIIAILFFFMPE